MKTTLLIAALSLLPGCSNSSSNITDQSERAGSVTSREITNEIPARFEMRTVSQKSGAEPSGSYNEFRGISVNEISFKNAQKMQSVLTSPALIQSVPPSCISVSDPSPDDPTMLQTDFYTRLSPEIFQVAGHYKNPSDANQYVKESVKNDHTLGASRSAQRTLNTLEGSVVDKANLLASIFKANKIPAYFIQGNIFLNDSMAKRFFGVRSTSQIVYRIASSSGKDCSSLPYQQVNGKNVWVIPHVWVRAFHDGIWHNYDPTNLESNFDIGSVETSVALSPPDLSGWLTLPDSSGAFVKSKSYIDFMYQKLQINKQSIDLSGTPIFGADQRFDGVATSQTACVQSGYNAVESTSLEYSSNITVKDSSKNSILSYSTSVAKMNEGDIYLGHSAGFLSELANGTAGNIQLKMFGQTVASTSAKIGDLFTIENTLSSPLFNSSMSTTVTYAKKYTAGDVFVFNTSVGRTSISDLNAYVRRAVISLPTTSNTVEKAATLLRMAGELFLFKLGRIQTDAKNLRDTDFIYQFMIGTRTTGIPPLVTNMDKTSLGIALVGGGIEAQHIGYLIPPGINPVDKVNVLKSQYLQIEHLLSASQAEATIWEELFGVPGYSAERLIQLGAEAASQGNSSYGIIPGLTLNGNFSQILSLVTNKSSSNLWYRDMWPSITTTYGTSGGTLWSLNREYSDSVTNLKVYGYLVIPKDLFSSGIAAFSYPDTTFAIINKPKNSAVITDQSTIHSDTSLEAKNNATSPSQSGISIFGGGSSSITTPVLEPDAGNSIANLPPILGVTPSGCSNLPVDFATGRMWHTFEDLALMGRTANTGIRFTRTYLTNPEYQLSSSWVAQGDLGKAWLHSYDTRILDGAKNASTNQLSMGPLTSSTSDVVWISQEGNELLFKNTGSLSSPVYQNPDGFTGALTSGSGSFILTLSGNLKLTFKNDTSAANNGRLLSITDPHGESVVLLYGTDGKLQTVRDPFAGDLNFSRDGNGRLLSVTSAKQNLTTSFTFTAGQLSSSTDFDGLTTSYDYNQNQVGTAAFGLLANVTDPLNRKIGFDYYQNGRVLNEKDHGGSIQSYVYAPYLHQKYTRVTTPNGSTTEYRYDDKFRVNMTIYEDGSRSFKDWSSNGKVASERDSFGKVTSYTYDTRGNRTSIQLPITPAMQITYDQKFDVPVAITPPIGAPTNFVVDQTTGDLLSTTQSDGANTLLMNAKYDGFGTQTSTETNIGVYNDATNENGFVRTRFDARNPVDFTYDSKGRVNLKRFANGRSISFTYNNRDQIVGQFDSDGPSIQNFFDAGHRLVKQVLSGSNITKTASFEYDDRDRITASTNYEGYKTQYQYDLVGVGCRVSDKPTRIISSTGKVTSLYYDYAGRKIRSVLPDGKQINFRYDLRGDLVAVIDPAGVATRYEYDDNRRLKNVYNQVPISQIDDRGRNIAVGSGQKNYVYDENGRIKSEIQYLANESSIGGQYITLYSYDSFGRLISKAIRHFANNQITERFDDISYAYLPVLGMNKPTAVTNRYLKLTFSYETQPPYALISFSRTPTAEGISVGLNAESYQIRPHVNGPVAQLTSQGQTIIQNQFDNLGRLLSAAGQSNGVYQKTNITYDVFGRRLVIDQSPNLIGQFSYDRLDHLSSLSWSGTYNRNESLFYSGDDQLLSRNHYGTNPNDIYSVNYSYFDDGSLKNYTAQAQGYPATSFDMVYDNAGNLTSYDNTLLKSAVNFTLQKNQPLAPDAMGLGFRAYDISPDQSVVNLIDYLPNGQISHIKGVKYNTDYFYDGLGRRVGKRISSSSKTILVNTTHLGLEDKILRATNQFSDSTPTTSMLLVDGPGIDDHLFSLDTYSPTSTIVSSYATDQTGSVLNSRVLGGTGMNDYKPFGGPPYPTDVGSLPVVYGFSGREFDPESGYWYYRARYYDSASGKFLSLDPVDASAGGDFNRYRYVHGDPVNRIDPSGNIEPITTALLVGGGIGAITGVASSYLTGERDPWLLAAAGGVGAVAGASGAVSGIYFAGYAAGALVNSAIGALGYVGLQTVTHRPIDNTSLAIATGGGLLGGIAGVAAGNSAFFGTNVIGGELGTAAASSSELVQSTIYGGLTSSSIGVAGERTCH